MGLKSLLPTPGDAAGFFMRGPHALLNRGLRLGTLESDKPLACLLKRSTLGAFCAGFRTCLKSSKLALALMIQSLVDVAGSPGVALFTAVFIAYVVVYSRCTQQIAESQETKKAR